MLRGLKKQQAAQRLAFGPAYPVTGLVFVQEDGTPWKPSSVTQAFKRKAEALELPACRLARPAPPVSVARSCGG